MSYQDLEEAFEHPKLTVSKLQRFRKEQLERFCETNSIKVQQRGIKKPIKAAYVAALFNAVCNCYDTQDTYSLASRDPPLQRRRPGLKCIFSLCPRWTRLTTTQCSWPRLTTRDDSVLIALSPTLTLVIVVHTAEHRIDILWQKMKKKPTNPTIPEQNFTMEIDGECAEVPMTPLMTMIWLTSVRDISQTGVQPSPAIPAEATVQSVNTDLRIHIPVLKRKRGNEWVKFSSISTLKSHLLLQRYNRGTSSKEI